MALTNYRITKGIIPTVKRASDAPNGVVLYDGPSALDGAPIVAVMTFQSSNDKTDNIPQVWILRSDVDPLSASRQKLDSSICGDCPHRRSTGGACYVTLHQAPLSVFRSYGRGNYPTVAPEQAAALVRRIQRKIRLGAYGDPAAVPFDALETFLGALTEWTGYTHQWQSCDRRWKDYLMASCDSPFDRLIAKAEGYRVFRATAPGAPLQEGEIMCVNESHGKTCAQCGLCDGTKRGTRTAVADIGIPVHGALASRAKVSG